MRTRLSAIACASLVLVFGLGGCGGGSDSVIDTTLVQGSIVIGPVAGATVTVFSVNPDGTRGVLLGTGLTNTNAVYAIPIPRQTGPILVEATNGTYDDAAVPGPDTTPLTAVLRGAATTDQSTTSVSINATPLTETAIRRSLAAPGGINGANLASVGSRVASDTGLPTGTDIFRSTPLVTEGTTDPYGIAVTNFSRLALTSGGVGKALDIYAQSIPKSGSSIPATQPSAPPAGSTATPAPAPGPAPAPAPAPAGAPTPAPAPGAAPAPAPGATPAPAPVAAPSPVPAPAPAPVPVLFRAPVNLGSAGAFTILSKSGITDVAPSPIVGDVGTSPISGSALLLTCPEVTGRIVIVDAAGPACAINDATTLTAAVRDMETAYVDAAGRTLPDFTELGAGEIGGMTLVPGLYKWGTGLSIGNDVTLIGGPDAVWIFQVAGTLNLANSKRVTLAGGAQAKNIFWQVGDSVTIGTTAHFEGVVLGRTLIAVNTGASATSRLLAQTAVTLQQSAITQPAK